MKVGLGIWAKLGIGALAIILAYALLPTVGGMLSTVLDEGITLLQGLAPKVAIAAALIAMFAWVLPFTRHHFAPMIKAAIMVAFGATIVSVGVPWAQTHVGGLTTDVLNGGAVLLAHVTSTISSAGGQ